MEVLKAMAVIVMILNSAIKHPRLSIAQTNLALRSARRSLALPKNLALVVKHSSKLDV